MEQVTLKTRVKTYRKKPVEIQAIELTWENWHLLAAFMPNAEYKSGWIGEDGGFTDIQDNSTETIGLLIHTLEGEMIARQGDFIIRGIKGEFYPCKPDIFHATYELASTGE